MELRTLLPWMRTGDRRRPDTALAFLAHLTDDFSVVLTLDDLLTHVTSTCRAELGFDSCSVALVDDNDHGAVRVRAASGLRTGFINVTYPPGKGLHGEVVRTGRPLLVPDMPADPRVYRLQPGIGSGIYAPMIVRNRVVGVLSAYRSAKNAFTPAEFELLGVVARYVAGAVEVARLHERVAEQALNSNHQLAQALDLVDPAMIIATLEDGTILRWNRAATDLYGHMPEDAVGLPLAMLEPTGRGGMWEEVLAAVRRGESVRKVDAVHTGKNGQPRRVALTAHPMLNAAGTVRWTLITVEAK